MNNENNKGFTITELLIVITIISIVSGLAVFNYQNFKEETIISNDAHKIIFALREARLFAVVGKEVQDGDLNLTDRFNRGYGVHFSSRSNHNRDRFFVSFVDIDDDGEYSGDIDCEHDECLEVLSLDGGNKVDSICRLKLDDSVECESLETTSVSIVFSRPIGENKLNFNVDDSSLGDYKGAVINIKSPGGVERSIIIKDTGVFSIE